jgi:hypothetical protein
VLACEERRLKVNVAKKAQYAQWLLAHAQLQEVAAGMDVVDSVGML